MSQAMGVHHNTYNTAISREAQFGWLDVCSLEVHTLSDVHEVVSLERYQHSRKWRKNKGKTKTIFYGFETVGFLVVEVTPSGHLFHRWPLFDTPRHGLSALAPNPWNFLLFIFLLFYFSTVSFYLFTVCLLLSFIRVLYVI